MSFKKLPSSLEMDLLLALFFALGAIDRTDAKAVAAYDELSSGDGPLSFRDIARKYDSQLLVRIEAIVIGGYLMNWPDGGAAALVTLQDWVKRFPPRQNNIEFQILSRTLDLGCLLAQWSGTDKRGLDDALAVKMSELAESFARFLCEHNQPGPAGELATFGVRFRAWAGMPEDASLMGFALRMMSKTKKQVFVPLTPRAKFPPPRRRIGVPPELLLELICRAMMHIFLEFLKTPKPRSRMRALLNRLSTLFRSFGRKSEAIAGIASIDDFNSAVRLMLADRDYVAFANVQFQYQYPDKPVSSSSVSRVELRFAQPLLKRVVASLSTAPGTSVTPYHILIDLIAQLLKNQNSVEWRPDEYLFDWFVLRGVAPYREGSLFRDAVLFVTATDGVVTVTIGETESDIEMWLRYGFLSERSREFLKQAKSQLA